MGALLTVATIVISAGAGVAAELRWRERAARISRALLVGSLYTVLPVVVFFNLVGAELDADVGVGIVLCWVALGLAAGLGLLASRQLGLNRPSAGSLLNSTIVANNGYLGYPLCAALLGFDSLHQAVLYDVLVGTPALLLVAFAIGAALGTKAGETAGERLRAFFTRNPPLLAAVAALLAPDSLAPEVLVDASRIAVIALLPLGFFVVGSALAEEGREEGSARAVLSPGADLAAAVVLRLLVAPALLLLLALPLIDLPDTYLLIMAMPCGINTLVVAHVYGLDARLSARAVAWSTAIVSAAVVVAVAIVGV